MIPGNDRMSEGEDDEQRNVRENGEQGDEQQGSNGSEGRQGDDDPFQLKQLAVNYDYLVYKINDHVATLSEQTFESVTQKHKLVNEDYLDGQLQLNEHLQHSDRLIGKCRELEVEFLKLDQIRMFVDDFQARVDHLEREFQKLS